ncbi:MAG: acyl--CoA ligase [Hyphomicrobiales bacterium]|nr:acyl--CoA ligase [Hyphomicrobiales bacterium]
MRPIHWASELAALAVRYADRIAVCDMQGEASYSTVFAKAATVGNALMEMGIRAGDAVATVFRNSADAVSASYGVMMSGAAEMALNPALGPSDLQHCLKLSRARVILTSTDLADGMRAAGLTLLRVNELRGSAFDSTIFPSVDPSAPARIVFTSGTTGPPKGAVHTHEGRWTANLLLRASLPHQPRSGSRILLMTPFAHGSSLMTFAYHSSGAAVTLLDGVDPPTVLDLLESRKCDAMFAPPTVLAKIAAAAEGRRLSSLRTIFCGTAVLTPTLYSQAKAIFGPVIRVTYGKSEVFNPITVMEAEETDSWYAGEGDDACVGWPAAGVELAIHGEDGTPVPTGNIGEILIRARHLMAGYLTKDGYRRVMPEEFHATGDLGYIDARGRLHLVGRADDMIKSGGYTVAPDEVERALAAVLQPSEVAVVGIPSEYWGEVVLAAVERPAPGWQARVEDIVKAMTIYKRPRLLVAFDELPRNGTGKIRRAAIRADILSRYRVSEGSKPQLVER